jgi:TPP-dependent pyruvate/acetoin dehydrogenase alpha subunit
VTNRVAGEQEVIEIEAQIRTEVEAALEFARGSEFPEPEEAFDHLYSTPIASNR